MTGLLVAALLLAPRVDHVSPAPDSLEAPSTTSISITFNRAMETDSVVSRLTIEPQRPGSLTWEGNTLYLRPDQPWESGDVVSVTLEAGSRSDQLLPVLRTMHWSFTVRDPQILYLWPMEGRPELYLHEIGVEEPERLTETPLGVLDYTVSADGEWVIYSAERPDAGSDLWLFDLSNRETSLLLSCPVNAQCQALALSPGKDILAFEQQEYTLGVGGRPILGSTQIVVLWLDSATDPIPVEPLGHNTSNPAWSANGWLGYYDETLKAIAIVDKILPSGSTPFNYVPNALSFNGSWSSDGTSLLFSEVLFLEDEEVESSPQFYSHIFKVDVLSGVVRDLSGENEIFLEDSSPISAPNGEWIAFTRKYLDEIRWSLGRQIWLMRSDGAEARQLTDEPDFHHGSLHWSPDSLRMVYMKKNQVDLSRQAEIWVYDLEEGNTTKLVEGGFLPQWVP